MDRIYKDEDLHEIYRYFVKKPASYFSKWEYLPPCPIRSWKNSYVGHDFPRIWCFLDLQEWVTKHNLQSPEMMASTDTEDPEMQLFTPKTLVEIPYPPNDLHQIATQYQSTFDFFLFSQTLEHLYNPYGAVRQIHATLKPGGYVFTSVPTINIPHFTPIHYGGINPMGLAILFISNGFRVIEIGQWGNYDYIKKLFAAHKWPDINDLIKQGRVTNEEQNVCQCWILAQKL
jgi:hypothetical protein